MSDCPYWMTRQISKYPSARVLVFDDQQIGQAIETLRAVATRISQEIAQMRGTHDERIPHYQADYRSVCRLLSRMETQAMEQQAIADDREAFVTPFAVQLAPHTEPLVAPVINSPLLPFEDLWCHRQRRWELVCARWIAKVEHGGTPGPSLYNAYHYDLIALSWPVVDHIPWETAAERLLDALRTIRES